MTSLLDLGPWGWIVAGMVLMALELLAPGAFMLWLGLAALVTGGLLFAMPMAWEPTLLVFAGLAVVFVLVGRRLSVRAKKTGEVALNDRAARIVGRTFVLETPIEEGRGRIRVDDTIWRVEGPDLPAGAQVEVVGTQGTLLKIRPA
ncbi:NfeD family protein [uncultured Alsobacter sp.]|uniref:NfeD family protein n=1 Tax=uncultured Alsobacter sp. TaxID=1748258 RepID=UPI0025DB3C06|nr:NfeD family protein [uncultured Alsobacter sp.]